MYIKVTSSVFIEAFFDMGREKQFDDDPSVLSASGLYALYDYLVECEEDSGEQWELDVIAICCDFERHESIAAYNRAYGTDFIDHDEIDEFACMINDSAFICRSH
jgi:hypothetical protein